MKNKDFDDGVLIKGRELLVSIGPSAAYADGKYDQPTTSIFQLATGDTSSPSLDYGWLPMNPGVLSVATQGGCPRLSQQATLYSRYCFRKIRLEYVPAVGTTTGGQFCIGYEPMSGYANAYSGLDNSKWFATVNSVVPNVASQWYSNATVTGHYRGDQTWSISLPDPGAGDILNLLGDASMIQGIVLGANFNVSSASVNYGNLYLSYEIEMFGGIRPQYTPSTSSFLLSSVAPSLRSDDAFREFLKDLNDYNLRDKVLTLVQARSEEEMKLRPPVLKRS